MPEIAPACRHPNDDQVLATAVAVNTDVIVTADKDLLALRRFLGVRIVTAQALPTELLPDSE